jgi:hypothetical protein
MKSICALPIRQIIPRNRPTRTNERRCISVFLGTHFISRWLMQRISNAYLCGLRCEPRRALTFENSMNFVATASALDRMQEHDQNIRGSRIGILVDSPKRPVNACATKNLVHRRNRPDLTDSEGPSRGGGVIPCHAVSYRRVGRLAGARSVQVPPPPDRAGYQERPVHRKKFSQVG